MIFKINKNNKFWYNVYYFLASIVNFFILVYAKKIIKISKKFQKNTFTKFFYNKNLKQHNNILYFLKKNISKNAKSNLSKTSVVVKNEKYPIITSVKDGIVGIDTNNRVFFIGEMVYVWTDSKQILKG